jgi:hypothetical protein
VLDILEPDPALSDAYGARFEGYCRLYQTLKPEFRRATPGL